MGRFQTFEPGANIVEHGEPASKLIMFVSGSVEVFIDHHHHHILDIRMEQGEFIGEMALLGFEDWGESVLLGVADIDIEVAACKDSFAVCLTLDAKKFERLMETHTISMQYAVHVYKKRRWDHKREYFAARVPGFDGDDLTLMSESVAVEVQRAEATEFIRASRSIIHWQWFCRQYLDRHAPTTFAAKLFKVAGSHTLSQVHELLDKHASEILDPRAQEKLRKINKEKVYTGRKDLDYPSDDESDDDANNKEEESESRGAKGSVNENKMLQQLGRRHYAGSMLQLQRAVCVRAHIARACVCLGVSVSILRSAGGPVAVASSSRAHACVFVRGRVHIDGSTTQDQSEKMRESE